MMRSSRFHCPIGVVNKPTTDRVVDITCILAVAKFSKSTIVMDVSSYRPMGASVARLIILVSGARSRSWN